MQEGKPSRTAFAAAGYRANHQLYDHPVLLADPHAVPILGPEAQPHLKGKGLENALPHVRAMRSVIVGRSLLAEQTLAAAYERGVRQYVLLGAGLDTFAYRNPWPDLTVYEIDYPATAAWKQASLKQAGITPPANVVYASIDFEAETITAGLKRAGVDVTKPMTFAWLGVIPYLTREAIFATLSDVASLPTGTEIVFDYGEPRENLSPMMKAMHAVRAKRLEAIGEPWITYFDPADLHAELKRIGFSEVEDFGRDAANARWFSASNLVFPSSAHLLRAKV